MNAPQTVPAAASGNDTPTGPADKDRAGLARLAAFEIGEVSNLLQLRLAGDANRALLGLAIRLEQLACVVMLAMGSEPDELEEAREMLAGPAAARAQRTADEVAG